MTACPVGNHINKYQSRVATDHMTWTILLQYFLSEWRRYSALKYLCEIGFLQKVTNITWKVFTGCLFLTDWRYLQVGVQFIGNHFRLCTTAVHRCAKRTPFPKYKLPSSTGWARPLQSTLSWGASNAVPRTHYATTNRFQKILNNLLNWGFLTIY